MQLASLLPWLGRFVPSSLPMIREFRRLRRKISTDPRGSADGTVFVLPYRINPEAQWFEFLLAYALRMRGYQVVLGIGEEVSRYTDGYFCSRSRLRDRLPSLLRIGQFAKAFDAEICLFSSLLGRRTIQELQREAFSAPLASISEYEKYDVCLGRHILGSLSRYFLRCEVDITEHPEIAREFLFTALVSVEAARKVIDDYKPDFLISSHGIYASWGPFCDLFGKMGIPFVTWGMQYKKHAFIFAHNKSYHRDLTEEPETQWRRYFLNAAQKEELLTYASSKASLRSHSDSINYYSSVNGGAKFSKDTIGAASARAVFGMFPNLGWDAQVSFRTLFFDTLNQWLVETVEWFVSRPDRFLIIRSHPAEVFGHVETVEKVGDVIRKHFPTLPRNVVIIEPDDGVTSYDVLDAVDACLVYGSKFGLEAALARKPLIIAGEAYFRNKGMSYDPITKEEYFEWLEGVPDKTPVTDEMYANAIAYGYHYFFRRQVLLPLAEMEGHRFMRYSISSLDDLKPGGLSPLDDFIDRMFSGRPFVNPLLC